MDPSSFPLAADKSQDEGVVRGGLGGLVQFAELLAWDSHDGQVGVEGILAR